MPVLSRKIRIKMKRDVGDILMQTIDTKIELGKAADDNDKLLFSALAEVSLVLYKRLGTNVHDFSIQLTSTQALALRLFYTDFVCDPTTYLGNQLHRIANMVHKQMNS